MPCTDCRRCAFESLDVEHLHLDDISGSLRVEALHVDDGVLELGDPRRLLHRQKGQIDDAMGRIELQQRVEQRDEQILVALVAKMRLKTRSVLGSAKAGRMPVFYYGRSVSSTVA